MGRNVEPPESLETCPDCDLPLKWMRAIANTAFVYDWLQCPSICAYSKLKCRDPIDQAELATILQNQSFTPKEVNELVRTRVCGKCEQYIPKDQQLNTYKDVGYCDRCFYGDILGKQSPPEDYPHDTDFDGNLPGMI